MHIYIYDVLALIRNSLHELQFLTRTEDLRARPGTERSAGSRRFVVHAVHVVSSILVFVSVYFRFSVVQVCLFLHEVILLFYFSGRSEINCFRFALVATLAIFSVDQEPRLPRGPVTFFKFHFYVNFSYRSILFQ